MIHVHSNGIVIVCRIAGMKPFNRSFFVIDFDYCIISYIKFTPLAISNSSHSFPAVPLTGDLYDVTVGRVNNITILLRDRFRNRLTSGGYLVELALFKVAGLCVSILTSI